MTSTLSARSGGSGRLWMRVLGMLAALAMLAGCGGDEAPGGGTSSGGGTTPNLGPAISVVIVDSSGAIVTQLAAGQTAQAQATLSRRGQPLANEIVNFTIAAGDLVVLSPATGAVLTDGTGTAKVTMIASNTASGATTLTASSTVNLQSATASTNFSVGLTGASALSISSFTVSAPPGGLSAYGSASMAVKVTDSSGSPPSQPVTVNFSSSCPLGKAQITASATTLPDGTAQGSFTDAGCAPTAAVDVNVTASISSESRSQTLRINAPTSGSLRFVSADPASRSITLKGQGGVGRQEFATLVFRLVDVAGNGVPNANVCFDATTYVGGLNLDGFNVNAPPPSPGSATLCGADNTLRYVKRTLEDGTVTVQVNSGTTPTPVRVRARTVYPAESGAQLETVSDSLSISTGLPLQRSFDLSWKSSNLECRNITQVHPAHITARLADQFGNPVPDGTVVNFIASGGAVCTSSTGSCTTVNGACTCDYICQEPRPSDGRVVVLAYTVGLEDYVDTNSNNQYDAGEPFTDMPDAFLDADKNGTLTPGEATLRYQNPNAYSPTGDGRRDTAHLRQTALISMGGSNSPTIIIPAAYNDNGAIRIPAGSCSASGVTPFLLPVWVDDGFGNPAPAGSGIATSGGAPIVGGTVDPGSVPNLVIGGPIASRDSPDVPKTSTSLSNPQLLGTQHRVTLTPVTVPSGTSCITGSTSVELRVTTPSGVGVTARVLFEDEPRTTARFAIPVVVQ